MSCTYHSSFTTSPTAAAVLRRTPTPMLIGAELMMLGLFAGMVVTTHESGWAGGMVASILLLIATTIFTAIWETIITSK